MTRDTMIGVDLAKHAFQLHGASMTGEVQFRKKLSRSQFQRFIAEHPPAVVVMEACSGAHYWARELARLGHEVRLIAPQYVRPFVKRQKNDAADAEAIVIAAQRPEMRFVEPKSEVQQARAALYRGRERLVRQRTELVNALRANLYEYGHTAPQGIVQLKRIAAIVDDSSCDLPELVREECRDLLKQIAEKTARIDARMKTIKALAAETDTARRLEDDARGGSHDRARDRGLRTGHEQLQARPRLRRLARARAPTVFIRGERSASVAYPKPGRSTSADF